MIDGAWWATYVVLWALVVFEAITILALARQVGLIQIRLGQSGARMINNGLELGDRAPEIHANDLSSRLVKFGSERQKPALLLFLSPNCSACEELAPSIATLDRFERSDTDVIIVSRVKDEEENRRFVRRHGLDRVRYLVSPTTADAYQVTAAPYGILVGADGRITSKGIVNTLEHLESLLNTLKEGFPSLDSLMNARVKAQSDGSSAREPAINS